MKRLVRLKEMLKLVDDKYIVGLICKYLLDNIEEEIQAQYYIHECVVIIDDSTLRIKDSSEELIFCMGY